jgi:predicted TPR repeat methyltransferase
MAREQFAHVSGIDITEDGVRYAREQLHLDIVQADLLQHDYYDRSFDVVCMWDTIEHLRAPHLYIEKISAHVPAGGLIALTTGDIDSLNARLKKEHWRLIHPPTHVHYFSQRTIKRMLGNYGFEVVYSAYGGFYRSMKNVAYNILVLRQGNRRLYNLLDRLGLYRFDFYLNMYDIMYVIARKKAAHASG